MGELPKADMRQQIQRAIASESLTEMRDVVAAAESVGLPDHELTDLNDAIEKFEKRESVRNDLHVLMMQADQLDLTNLDKMRYWRSKITAVLRQGKLVGLTEEELKP